MICVYGGFEHISRVDFKLCVNFIWTTGAWVAGPAFVNLWSLKQPLLLANTHLLSDAIWARFG